MTYGLTSVLSAETVLKSLSRRSRFKRYDIAGLTCRVNECIDDNRRVFIVATQILKKQRR